MNHITAANVETAYELEHKHDKDQTRLQKVADVIAKFSGTVAFIIWHIAIFSAWIIYNSFGKLAFDPYPFTFLTMTVSLESIMLSGILLINQAKIGAIQDRRHQLDLQVNLLAEQENTMMLRVLDRIATKLGVDSTELQDYLEDVRADELADVIETAELSRHK